ncbi:MAG: hypothetical protein ACRYG2_08265, partial [Janthinobacterium lividum]
MLSRRTARHPYAAPRRSRLCRALPALAFGVTALALAVPTSLPATASPGGPAAGTGSGKATTSKAVAPSGKHLTAAAEEAGLEVGNATMGWRERGTERAALQQHSGLLRYGAVARSSTSSFTPDGVLGVDISSYQG